MALLKTIIFAFLVSGTATILVPYWLLSSPSSPRSMQLGVFRNFGVLPTLVGTAIYFWCAWDFTFAGRGTPAPIDPPTELVVRALPLCQKSNVRWNSINPSWRGFALCIMETV
jgi:hypothetical protein